MEKGELGRLGEEAAARLLKESGYKITARNVNLLPHGELDIVADNKGIVHFFEVRTAHIDSPISPLESLGRSKLRKLRRAVEIYRKRACLTDREYTVNLVAVEVKGGKVTSVEVIPHILEGVY